jgi:ATP-dependent phosphoenolpyruvate carboxykinase
VGYRFKLRHTRAIVDAIHSGEVTAAEYETMPTFNLQVGACSLAGVGVNVGWQKGWWGRGVRQCRRAQWRSGSPFGVLQHSQLFYHPALPRVLLPCGPCRLQVPKTVSHVPQDVLMPINCWADKENYTTTLTHLAELFVKNFTKFEVGGGVAVLAV